MSTAPDFVLAQITDMHLCIPGELAYGRINTDAAMKACIASLKALNRKPDAIIATGDLVDLGQRSDYVYLRELLDTLSVPLYLMPGNHDDRDAMVDVFSDHDYLQQMRRTGSQFLQYAVDLGPFRLVALDTLVPRRSSGALCQERLDWLHARLSEDSKPTIVAMHHPPFDTGIEHMDRIGLDGGPALEAVLARHPHVERVICGHLHRTIIKRMAGTVVSVAPSPAHQIALELRPKGPPTYVMEPPGYQLHIWSTSGGLVTHNVALGEYGGHRNFGE
jgi:3',5'-cyclic AMP phosphodiesterase CpdA